VTQEDDCAVSFATKIWGKTKEFKASIETQRPDERIKWKVSQGITHAGVVTFHELAPNLTRIEVTLDVQPGSLIEKAARGMRHVKRAVRGDLHRFKAFIEMQEFETGAWRGVIIDGELVEPHDESYDEDREYSELEAEEPSASTDEEDEQAEADNEEQVEDEEPVEEDEPVEDEQPVAESEDEESDEDEGDDQPKRRSKQARGRRSRTVSTNGHGKPERVGSGGGRRRRSATG
jgi:cobalamin biosynthesis protein CobT